MDKSKTRKKIALTLSLCAIFLWCGLGAGASLAWFTDTAPVAHNIFHFAQFQLEVCHRLPDGSWEPVDRNTPVFAEQALYEPGYTQVVYLKAKNTGTAPFSVYTAVTATGHPVATNSFGQPFYLHEHLRFGICVAGSQAEMLQAVQTRDQAVALADRKLSNYGTDTAILQPGETAYIALVVCMPESVGNEANYRGGEVPSVELGLIVKAEQITQEKGALQNSAMRPFLFDK